MVKQIIQSHRSVICLGKEIDKTLFSQINPHATIVAADGAGHFYKKQGLQPHYILGDLDSFDHTNMEGTTIIQLLDQDTTDFEKCIAFVKNKNRLPSLVLGINGGEIDHILGNVQALIKHGMNSSLFFLDFYQNGYKLGIPLSKGIFRFNLELDSMISIIPFELCYLTSQGLKWELNQEIKPDGILAIRNKNISNSLQLEVKKGKALMVIDLRKLF